jgi:predicted permease
MGSLRSQLRQVLRRLGRSPGFTAVILLTVAVGVGANTAIFSVVESVLLRPLPYPHPHELVGVWHAAPKLKYDQIEMSPSNYFIYREQGTAFQDVGLYADDAVSVTRLAEPEKVKAVDVTDGVLPILGAVPVLGRTFTRADDQPGSPKTVVLSYAYWHRRFADDPSAVGRTLVVDGAVREIIGVLPASFTFLDWGDRGLFLPMQLDRAKTVLGNFSYAGIGRLKPGITLAQANADVARMLPIVLQSFPTPPGFSLELFKNAGFAANVHPLVRDVVGNIGDVLWVLVAGIGLVLLIACANVANLLLVRAEGRQQELAVRAALGASRGRIAAELLFESLVIGLLGALLGLALAYAALQVLIGMAPEGLPRLAEIGIDLPTLVFTLAISLFASLLFGCVPILKYAGAGAFPGLGDGGRTSSHSRERHRARNTLVIVQVSLAFVLLICSGLMIRTFRALTHVNPGFASRAPIQTFRVSLSEDDVPDREKAVRIDEDILRRIAAIPGVASAAFISGVPMDGNNSNDPVFAQDRTYATGELPPIRRFKFSSPEAFATLGIPFVAGRAFGWTDVYQKTPVVVVSEKFARETWQQPAAAIGKRIRVGDQDDWREVIGVVGDVRDDGMNKDAPSIIYWPILLGRFEGQEVVSRREVAFVIRSERAGSESLMKEVRRAVWSVDANLPIANVQTLSAIVQKSMARTSFTLIMLSLAGGMALLLGTIGLYGVVAYSVSKRTREIGIRMALGAQNRELLAMFVRQGLWLTLAGVAAGLVLVLLAMRLMSSLLYDVSSVDPLTYAAVSVGLVVTAALASYLPSRRAAAVDPSEALRSE